jgi:hypothetical protein
MSGSGGSPPESALTTTASVSSAALSEIVGAAQKLFRWHLHRRGVGHHHRRWSWCRGWSRSRHLWLGLGLLSLCRLRRRWGNGLRMSRHGRWSRLRLLHRSRRRYQVCLCRSGCGHQMLSRDRYGRWSRLRLLHRSRRRYHVCLCRSGCGHQMLSRDRYGHWRRLCRHWRRRDFRLCRCWFRRRRSLGVRRGRGAGRLWVRPRRDCGRPRFRLCRGLRLLRRF